jgi:hypothetical protein
MEKQARESTSLETGVRLTGCQVKHCSTRSNVLDPLDMACPVAILHPYPKILRQKHQIL